MTGNPLQAVRIVVRVCALMGVLALMTGCGFKLAGPAETLSIAALSTEDLAGPCKFDMNLPDEPLADLSQNPTKPEPTETAALVIYERGDSASLFNDTQVQNMAANLHMVTVFAHQCNAKTTGDLQGDATQGQARTLFAALTQYATDSHHPEIANLKVVINGFSAAGTLTTTMAAAYPDRILAFIPYATGDPYIDLDNVPVSAATARIPALVLANAYDPASGDERSLRYFQRGWAQGAPWAFGAQNHTAHCCTASIRDLMVPWVSALVQPLVPAATGTSSAAQMTPTINWAAQAATDGPTVRFWCYTDGFYDAYGEADCFIYSASLLPSTSGGPQAAWLPDAASADAWLTWVTSPGTN